MKPELLNQLRKFKGKKVRIFYGEGRFPHEGQILSWTTGHNAKVWLTFGSDGDISIPLAQVKDIVPC